jgi:hypothetical protein
MKQLIIVGFAILALGCTKPQSTTTQKGAPEEGKLGGRQEVTSTMSDDADQVKESNERTRVTGYGDDPGEETQE